jgi:N-acetylglucosamine-6-sulfatase
MKGAVTLVVAAALAVVLSGAAGRVSAAPAASKPLNIVLIDTDDQTQASLKFMPNVKRLLVDQGVTFDNSFVSYSLCCPSRATVLTGQYAHNHGVLGNSPPNGGYHKLDHSNTLAVWLQRAGYRTILIGKYLNGYGKPNPSEVPPGWSEWYGLTKLTFLGGTINENGKLVNLPKDESGYQTDVLARLAEDAIRRSSRGSQPFFLWLTPHVPHNGGPADPDDPAGTGTTRPPARYRDHFASQPLPMPPSFNEADVSDKPVGIRNRPLLTAQKIAGLREAYQQALEANLGVDDAVKSVVDTLRSTGELDNTLIAFTSDNGFFYGEHRVPAGKVLLYEPSIRVPLVVHGPGIPKGVHRKQIAANVDLAPTFVQLTKAKAGRVMDGRTLVPLFRSASAGANRDLLLEDGLAGGKKNSRQYVAVRTPRYLYAEYANGEHELYDLATDPNELNSRHADPALVSVRERLARILARLRTCAGPNCRSTSGLAR